MPHDAPAATADNDSLILGDVVARLAAEVTAPLTQALERVSALATHGRIDRAGLLALRDEIRLARAAGLRGQQIARFIDGRAHPAIERVDLAEVLRTAIADQTAEGGVQAPAHRHLLASRDVMGDAPLIHRLLRAATDWAAGLTRSAVDWTLDLKPWPVRARIVCRFAYRPADLADSPAAEADIAALDTLDWLLLQYAAHVAGVLVRRDLDTTQCTLTLEFPHTLSPTLEGSATADRTGPGHAATLVAGSQVLVVAARRELRQLVREALRGHDLFIDYVGSVPAARDYCDDGMPQALIYEAGFSGDALQQLLNQLSDAAKPVALVEIAPSGQDYDAAGPVARVGADGLRHTLPAVLGMALSQSR